MIFCNLPLLIVSVFLLLTLLIGISFSKQQTSFRGYAIGNKKFSTASLIATVLATLYGGDVLIRGIESTYEYGVWWMLICIFSTFGCWIVSKLALRMGPFMDHFSIPQTIGSIYGKYPKIVASLVEIFSCIIFIILQIKSIYKVIAIYCIWIDPKIFTLFISLVIIFYSSCGGICAITFTNILQLLIFIIIIPLLGCLIFIKVGKPVTEIFFTLKHYPRFSISQLLSCNRKLLSGLCLLLSIMTSYVNQRVMQRVYMSSGPRQSSKVFANATLFNIIIAFIITLIALFIFVKAPYLSKDKVWPYIINSMPIAFKGLLAICLLAMAISTTDASLNSCSVIVSHDILKMLYNKQKISDVFQIKVARWTTSLLGLLCTYLSLVVPDLFKLMYWGINSLLPIVPAPFMLAIYGFRGTSRTALIGMATGLVTILIWNQSIKPLTEIDGAFLAMVANGLAMMGAHYLCKQPAGKGWVEPDNIFKQIQQENSRRYTERKAYVQKLFINKKKTLYKILPSNTTVVSSGLYLVMFNLVSHFMEPGKHNSVWFVMQLFLGAFFIGYPFIYDVRKKTNIIPKWMIGLIWVITWTLYLPFNVIWHLSHDLEPIFATSLYFTHCFIVLSLLPLYLGIRIVGITFLLAIVPIYISWSFHLFFFLLPLFMLGIVVFAILICLKTKLGDYTKQILYLKDQEKIRTAQQIKSALYDAEIIPFNHSISAKGYGVLLKEIVYRVEQSIAFLDNDKPLFKEDFQIIINKFYDWIDYFKRKEQAKHHALLQTTKITLDKLIRRVEISLSQELNNPPRILVEKIKSTGEKLASRITCDVNQIVYALFKSILRIAKLKNEEWPIICTHIYPTSFKLKQANTIDNNYPSFTSLQGIAILISSDTSHLDDLPKPKKVYSDFIDNIDMAPKVESNKARFIDLDKETISSIVRAHYGYVEEFVDQKQASILLVLPVDVTYILDKINVELSLDNFSQKSTISLKEEADAMVLLMKFHDDFCKYLNEESPADLKIISESVLLLRKYFRFKRHASGQLFYVRVIGITQLVEAWAFHYHKLICAALLYELVRHNCIPLSYIKKHYDLGIYRFVSNLVQVDTHQDLDYSSLLYVQNRFEKAIKENHVQISVLCIKLAERLYDLRYAANYKNTKAIAYMAQETLATYVHIANTYLDEKIGTQLEEAAKEALKICNIKRGEIR